jgi:restriction system protein
MLLYIQAKKWDCVIGRPEIQNLLEHYKVKELKGIFITTGSFSKEAKEYTNKIDSKIVLIDGKTTNRIYDRQKYRSNFREVLFYKEIRPGQF